MENKQTAISWLKDMLEWNYGDPQMLEISWENLDDLLERAKQMEKEQIMQSYNDGKSAVIHIEENKSLEQYYNEIYNK